MEHMKRIGGKNAAIVQAAAAGCAKCHKCHMVWTLHQASKARRASAQTKLAFCSAMQHLWTILRTDSLIGQAAP